MGAQQSTRKLTLDNDDPTNVIKVSDAVVNRLRGSTEAGNTGASTSTAGTPIPAPAPAPAPAVPAHAHVPHMAVSPLHRQHYNMYEPMPTSVQARQAKEGALQKNDEYWQERINKLEETHEQMNQIMKKEYDAAIKEVKEGFNAKPEAGLREPACVEGKKAVMQCYKKYPNEPMRCAKEVQDFADCVDKHRSALVSNRG